jgi:hypothetical protein
VREAANLVNAVFNLFSILASCDPFLGASIAVEENLGMHTFYDTAFSTSIN